MRKFSVLVSAIIGFGILAGAAEACETVTVGASLKRHQLHCDLTRGLTAEDVSFLSGKLGTEYRIAMNEVSEEDVDAGFYLGIALILGQGIEADAISGAKLLADVAEKEQSFDAYDRPGMAFFSALGFSNNVGVATLRAILLGTGPGSDTQSLALIESHIEQVGRAGNSDAILNVVALINRDVPSNTSPEQRPGYLVISGLAERHVGAARLLSDWTGAPSGVLQKNANIEESNKAEERSAAKNEDVSALVAEAKTASRSGNLDDMARALDLYEKAQEAGYPAAVYIMTLKRRIAKLESDIQEAEAAAEIAAKVMPRVADNPDAVKAETWKLTTGSITRPLCGRLSRSGGMPALLAGNAATLHVKNDGCEFFSIMAGSFRIAVGQVDPGQCDKSGCDVTLRIGCRSRGAQLLSFCSDFYSNNPQYLSARLEPDAASATGFRLRIP